MSDVALRVTVAMASSRQRQYIFFCPQDADEVFHALKTRSLQTSDNLQERGACKAKTSRSSKQSGRLLEACTMLDQVR